MKKVSGLWVIAPINGCYKTLLSLLEQIPKNSEICFLGDLIDRGPSNMDVLSFIKKNYPNNVVMGNHEFLMIHEHDNPKSAMVWLQHGGDSTLNNFKHHDNSNISNRTRISLKDAMGDIWDSEDFQTYLGWMKNFPYFKSYQIGQNNIVVSHSSILNFYNIIKESTNVHYSKEEENELIWGEKKYGHTNDTNIKWLFNIYGHPIQVNNDNQNNEKHSININSAVTRTETKNMGTLTAFHYPSFKKIIQNNLDL